MLQDSGVIGDLVMGGTMPTGYGGTVGERPGNTVTSTLATYTGVMLISHVVAENTAMLHYTKGITHVK